MRFPEVALSLRRSGAQILTFPSAFAVRTGAAHWSTLLQARAIDTQCWVVAAAQVGTHPGTTRTSWGHAMIVDPWGSIVAQCRYGAACMTSPRISDTCAATCRHLRLRLDWPILYVHNRPHSYPTFRHSTRSTRCARICPFGSSVVMIYIRRCDVLR